MRPNAGRKMLPILKSTFARKAIIFLLMDNYI